MYKNPKILAASRSLYKCYTIYYAFALRDARQKNANEVLSELFWTALYKDISVLLLHNLAFRVVSALFENSKL